MSRRSRNKEKIGKAPRSAGNFQQRIIVGIFENHTMYEENKMYVREKRFLFF